jgi:hypothetical protein
VAHSASGAPSSAVPYAVPAVVSEGADAAPEPRRDPTGQPEPVQDDDRWRP